MKKILSLVFVLWGLVGYAQIADRVDSIFVIYYFGSSSCGYCNTTEGIAKLNMLVDSVSSRYPNFNIKKVIVSLDKDIRDGLDYLAKYKPGWNEISTGSFYENELAMRVLNTSTIPGVPHIIAAKQHIRFQSRFKIPLLINSEVVIDLVGASQINQWITAGYPGLIR